jgi:hypothetical protein
MAPYSVTRLQPLAVMRLRHGSLFRQPPIAASHALQVAEGERVEAAAPAVTTASGHQPSSMYATPAVPAVVTLNWPW